MALGAAARALALGIGAVVYAGLSFGNGLDRLSLNRPVNQAWVPAALQAQVLRQAALAEIRSGRSDSAAALARKAVVRAPLEPGSTALLGTALYIAGQRKEADDAFQVARRLGWRDPSTQAYWLARSVSAEDFETAVERVDAILRADPNQPAARQWLVALEANPDGRKALAARLAEGPDWIAAYAAGAALLDSAAFARRMDLVERSAAARRRPSCNETFDAINTMAYKQGRFTEARRLWLSACAAPGDTGLIANGSFDQDPAGIVTPFNWTLPGAAGLYAVIDQGALHLRNDTGTAVAAAQQFVILAPGPHRLSWSAAGKSKAGEPRILVSLRCPDRRELMASAGAGTTGAALVVTADISIPANCQPQLLTISAPSGSGDMALEKIEAVPLPH